MDLMLVYKIIFATGVLYAVVSFLIGQLFDFNNFQLHVHLDGDMPLVQGFSPFKPITIVTFITVFGGVGVMALTYGVQPVYSVLISFMISLIISCIIYKGIVLPLYKSQNTSVSSQNELIGIDAKVTSTIFKDGFGTISYVKNKNTYSSPAKHIDGKTVVAGEKVFIVRIENNIFYVNYQNDSDIEENNNK